MKKYLQLMFALLAAVTLTASLSSCSDDKDEPSGSDYSGEWYVSPSGFATSSDFTELNRAIDNHELLSDYGRIGKHYAEYDEFIDSDGRYSDSDANKGRFRFCVPSIVNILHIIDDSTAEFYGAWLFVDLGEQNGNGEDRIWHFYSGSHFGEMAYYLYGCSNKIYVRKGNTLVFSDGTIYIQKPEGLQGDNGLWKKFTPKP